MFNPGATLNKDTPETFRRMLAGCFQQQVTQSKLLGLWAFITRKPVKLRNLQTIAAGKAIINRHYAGLQTVVISRIIGSETHTPAFDAQFKPIACRNQQRWISVAIACSLDIPLPPVALIQLGREYFVRDGHHRVSVAKLFGREFIEAEVIVWQTESAAQPMPPKLKSALPHPSQPAISSPANANTCR